MTRNTAQRRNPLLELEGLGIAASADAPLSIVGLPPTARALVLLDMARVSGAPIVIVTRADAEAESLVRDMAGLARLTGALEPDAIGVFPALDADPYDGLAAHLGAVCARVRWLWPVSYTHLRAHETPEHLVCRL